VINVAGDEAKVNPEEVKPVGATRRCASWVWYV